MKNPLELLELFSVKNQVADLAVCSGGKARVQALCPTADLDAVNASLARTQAAADLLCAAGSPPISSISDPSAPLARAKAGGTLAPAQLLCVAELLRCTGALWRYGKGLSDTPLLEDFALLHPNEGLEQQISMSILSEDQIADSASAALAEIRQKIRRAGSKARQLLEGMIRNPETVKLLQEPIVTLRDGRFVVPVKAEHRHAVKGLVHDTSGTGATVFIEPMGVVEANNQIRLLEGEEQEEITRILTALSQDVAAMADWLLPDYETVCDLDCLFAKAKYAQNTNASLPIVNNQGRISLKAARHPLIDPKKVVPIDLYLGGAFDTLVITGPNTGGKTVSLKTLGLLSLMAMCGLAVPAKEGSELAVFEHILADMGDDQSIAQSLSTFSSHMKNLVEILAQADSRSLVLLDELGSGTDPTEGAALAVAIIQALRGRGAKVAATTHYAELKLYALETAGVENGCCEFDLATLSPTYRLLIGVPGRSNAFAISQKLGLPEEIVQAAKDRMSQESLRFEDVVSSLELARQQAKEEQAQTAKLRAEADALRASTLQLQQEVAKAKEAEIEKGRQRAKQLVAEVQAQGRKLIEEMEALAKETDEAGRAKRLGDARQLLKAGAKTMGDVADPVTQKAAGPYVLPRKLKVGDEVTLATLGSRGVVLALPDAKEMVLVQAGLMKTKLPLSELRLCEEKKTTKKGSVHKPANAAKAAGELMLLGMNVEEALLELDRYLDQAARAHLVTVRIVHGKGTGTLRRAVQSHLKGHRQVKEYRLGVYGEGEDGVTIATLK